MFRHVFRPVKYGIGMLLVVALSYSCRSKESIKTLDLGSFTIDVPSTWEPVRTPQLDSYLGRIALPDGDTLHFDFGWYSNPLEEEPPFTITGNDLFLLDSAGPQSEFYSFYGKTDTIDLDKFYKNKIEWTQISGRRAKLVSPKKPGYGTTGVYFDSVWIGRSGVDRLQINGRNLQPLNQAAFLEAILTIKFTAKPTPFLDNHILGVWTDGSGPNASFSITSDSIYYVEHSTAVKYQQTKDSITVFYEGVTIKSRAYRSDWDTLILESPAGKSKYWRFKD